MPVSPAFPRSRASPAALDLGWPLSVGDDAQQLPVYLRLQHPSLFGFVIIVAAFLFTMMDRRAVKSAGLGRAVAWLAFASSPAPEVSGVSLAMLLFTLALMPMPFLPVRPELEPATGTRRR